MFELFAFPDLIFVAPLETCGPASVAAKNIAVCPAACMVHLAGIDVSAVVGIILDQIAVALDLTGHRRRGLAEILGYSADGMPVIQAIFDLGAVFESKMGTFARR